MLINLIIGSLFLLQLFHAIGFFVLIQNLTILFYTKILSFFMYSNFLTYLQPIITNEEYVFWKLFPTKLYEVAKIAKNIDGSLHVLDWKIVYPLSDDRLLSNAFEKKFFDVNTNVFNTGRFSLLFLLIYHVVSIILALSFFYTLRFLYFNKLSKFKDFSFNPNNLSNVIGIENVVNNTKITFNDIIGLEEVKEELKFIMNFIQKFDDLKDKNLKIPKGVLFFGPPGTGKTLMAKALANNSNSIFIQLTVSDLRSPYVNVGCEKIKKLFQKAKTGGFIEDWKKLNKNIEDKKDGQTEQPEDKNKKIPKFTIIFIDEIDQLGSRKSRSSAIYNDGTIEQFLHELDGIESEKDHKILVIGATNFKDSLDEAIIRSGRLEKHIKFELPNFEDRRKMIKRLTEKREILFNEIEVNNCTALTFSKSCADIDLVINTVAAKIILKEDKRKHIDIFSESLDEILLGLKSSVKMNEENREITAVHEAGHAIVAFVLKEFTKLIPQKITITSRASYLGYVYLGPEEEFDYYAQSFNGLFSQICISFGGYIAEEVFFGQATVGASSDLQNIRKIVDNILSIYCLKDNKYASSFAANYNYGNSSFKNSFTEKYAYALEKEANLIINNAKNKTIKIIKDNFEILTTLKNLLLEKETMHKKEIFEIITSTSIKNKNLSLIKKLE